MRSSSRRDSEGRSPGFAVAAVSGCGCRGVEPAYFRRLVPRKATWRFCVGSPAITWEGAV